MRTRVGLGAVFMLALLAAGCGEKGGGTATDPGTASDSTSGSVSPSGSEEPSGDPSPTASETPKTEPTCESVWVEDAILPRSYRGCYNGERWVRVHPIYCSFGGRIITYDNRFWAAPGHAINRAEPNLRKDPDFQQAFGACTA